jgi:hypothetical protein
VACTTVAVAAEGVGEAPSKEWAEAVMFVALVLAAQQVEAEEVVAATVEEEVEVDVAVAAVVDAGKERA